MIKEESTTIAILTKLIVISKVASSRFGFSSNLYTSFDLLLSASLSSKNCAGLMAKKAVSAPDIYPEMKSKTTKTIVSTINPTEKKNNGDIIEIFSGKRENRK